MKHLAYHLSGQGEYDEALKLGKEVRSKLELAFTFEASDRLNELEGIMKVYVSIYTCMHMVHVYYGWLLLTCSINEEREKKMRKEEEERIRKEMARVKEKMERKKAELKMLKEQEEARRKIPKAPPPPPVVELEEEAFLWEDDGELENIVLDTGMHTVKVVTASYSS